MTYRLYFIIFVLFGMSGCTVMPGTGLTLGVDDRWFKTDDQNNAPKPFELVEIDEYFLKKQKVVPQEFNNPENELKRIERYQYHIGINDIIDVVVWGHPELTTLTSGLSQNSSFGRVVRDDGTMFFPHIGNLSVVGLTIKELRDTMEVRLTEYLESPQVDVNVKGFLSQKVYLTGEVKKPGIYNVENIPLTVLDVISKAGGLLEEENDWYQVKVNRTTADNKNKVIYLNLYDLLVEGDISQNILLQNNDRIHIEKTLDKKVFVMGELESQKSLDYHKSMTLAEVIAEAGGLDNTRANAAGVFVIRDKGAEGKKPKVYQLDLRSVYAMLLAEKFQIQSRDVVYVTSTDISKWNSIISNLLPSVSIYRTFR